MWHYLQLLIVLLAPALGACCVWDRDTLASEAKGQEAVADAITGKIDRFPPRFYEMRFARLEELLKTKPFDLGLYDDCATALNRLGKHDDALAWCTKKREAMAKFQAGEGPRDSRYRDEKNFTEQSRRLLVNEASIRLQRWVAKGLPRDLLDDVKIARSLIADARKLNATFESERYLQMLAEWFIAGEQPEKDRMLPEALGLRLANKTARGPNDELKNKGLTDCFDGLAGLIRSSETWECVDVFYWLSLAFAVDGKQSLAYMARLRAFELIDAGKGSFVPGAPKGDALKAAIVPYLFESGRRVEAKTVSDQARAEIEEEFGRRRRFAQRMLEARWEFMATKFEMGAHPDIDLRFWAGYEPPTMLKRDLPTEVPEEPKPTPAANVPPAATSLAQAPPSGNDDDALERGLVMFAAVGAATVLVVSLGLWWVMKRGAKA